MLDAETRVFDNTLSARRQSETGDGEGYDAFSITGDGVQPTRL